MSTERRGLLARGRRGCCQGPLRTRPLRLESMSSCSSQGTPGSTEYRLPPALQELAFELGRSGIFVYENQEQREEHIASENQIDWRTLVVWHQRREWLLWQGVPCRGPGGQAEWTPMHKEDREESIGVHKVLRQYNFIVSLLKAENSHWKIMHWAWILLKW